MSVKNLNILNLKANKVSPDAKAIAGKLNDKMLEGENFKEVFSELVSKEAPQVKNPLKANPFKEAKQSPKEEKLEILQEKLLSNIKNPKAEKEIPQGPMEFISTEPKEIFSSEKGALFPEQKEVFKFGRGKTEVPSKFTQKKNVNLENLTEVKEEMPRKGIFNKQEKPTQKATPKNIDNILDFPKVSKEVEGPKERPSFFFTNKKLEDVLPEKLSDRLQKNERPIERSFFPKKEIAKQPQNPNLQLLDNTADREALFNKTRIPTSKVHQTYFEPNHKIPQETKLEGLYQPSERMSKAEAKAEMFLQSLEMNQTGPKVQEGPSFSSLNVEQKALDLSNLTGTKTEVIDKITDYITRNSFGNQKSLTVNVTHKDLGKFQIQANRNGDPGDIHLKILTNNEEGRAFFNSNEQGLIKGLSEKGIRVFDFKVTSFANSSPTHNMNKDDSGFSFSQNQNSHAYGKESENFQHDRGQERRRELWERYREQLGA